MFALPQSKDQIRLSLWTRRGLDVFEVSPVFEDLAVIIRGLLFHNCILMPFLRGLQAPRMVVSMINRAFFRDGL